jgi:hypothetical protein
MITLCFSAMAFSFSIISLSFLNPSLASALNYLPAHINIIVAQRPTKSVLSGVAFASFNSSSGKYIHQRRMTTNSDTNNDNVGLTDAGESNRSPTEATTDEAIDWKSRIDISIAKSRKIRGSNYVQISTVDHTTMEPRCRTVVFRGFMKDVPTKNRIEYGDCVMKMITDLRSNKVKELESFYNADDLERNNVEMVWW